MAVGNPIFSNRLIAFLVVEIPGRNWKSKISGNSVILDKMEGKKAPRQQVLKLDVVRSHEHLRVCTEALKDCLAGSNSLRCVGTTKELID
jgi:hypothetical protein